MLDPDQTIRKDGCELQQLAADERVRVIEHARVIVLRGSDDKAFATGEPQHFIKALVDRHAAKAAARS